MKRLFCVISLVSLLCFAFGCRQGEDVAKIMLEQTMLATQIPVADWHDRLGNATLSDAVMDRIIHNAYRLELCGESMRKRRSPLTHSGHKEV